jgi:uncharacterized protein
MRIVVDINHPAHVHYFKNFIWEMKQRGHEVLITASHKDIATQLLQQYELKYVDLGSYGSSLLNKMIKIPIMDVRMYQAVRAFGPDIFIGMSSVRAAHVSKVLGIPSVIFDDTEHAGWGRRLYAPFCNVILTPSSFNKNLGEKQVCFNGYMELASLHPNRFTPNPVVLDELGLGINDNIFLIRFAAFDASHDTNTEHFDKRYIPTLISKLEEKGTVIISSEVKLDPALQKYQYKLPPNRYHDLLCFSKMYIGEGSTTAIEAAVLGVPSLHFERLNIHGQISTVLPFIGVMNELQMKYELLHSFCDEKVLLSKVDELLKDLECTKDLWNHRKKTLLKDKIDVTAFMVWFIDNYPLSHNQLRKNKESGASFDPVLGW